MEQYTGDFRLTTARILYYLPDYPSLLQTFLWQHYDTAPDYPVLKKFLDYWQRHIEGPVHSVAIASRPALGPTTYRYASASLAVH